MQFRCNMIYCDVALLYNSARHRITL